MRHLPAKLYLAALCALANAQSLEPDTDGLFYPLAHNPDRLIALDRQTATIHTSAKWVGIGATAKSTSEFKPGKSPVRVSSGTTYHHAAKAFVEVFRQPAVARPGGNVMKSTGILAEPGRS
jgi:hypothetical protein